ncbi:MAG: tyrosine-type recombinase/integrase [Spirochaetales bacterium]|nr:tyrosine-type recombinase/integrase [Spirochaetales bacterium]
MNYSKRGKYKYLREIEKNRMLYKDKNLKYVRNKWVFYWRFLAYLEDIGYRQRTLQRFHEKLRMFLDWIGKKSLRRVKKKDIEEYLLYLKNEKQIAPYTIRYVKETIGIFFAYVMRFSRMKVNPTSNLGIRIHYKQPEKMDYFSQEEITMLIKKPLHELKRIKRTDFPTDHSYNERIYTVKLQHMILKLMFSTGIRPWEVVHSKVNDLNTEKLRLRVHTKGNQQYIIKDRHVFITETTSDELKELLLLQKPIRRPESENRLFIHYSGGLLSSNYPNIIVKYWALRCGIKRNVYAYMIRYTYCTRLVENGVDVYSLKKLMGHKQLAVTLKHYLKLTPAELRREWKEFNPLQKEEVS